MAKSPRRIPSKDLPRKLAILVRQYRKAYLSADEVADLLYCFGASDIGWEPTENIDEFIAKNREILKPFVDEALRADQIGGAQ